MFDSMNTCIYPKIINVESKSFSARKYIQCDILPRVNPMGKYF